MYKPPRKISISTKKLPRPRRPRGFGKSYAFPVQSGPAAGGEVHLRTFSTLAVSMRGWHGMYERGHWINAT